MKMLVLTKGNAIYYGEYRKKNKRWVHLKDVTWKRNSNRKSMHYNTCMIKKKSVRFRKFVEIDVAKYSYKELMELVKG